MNKLITRGFLLIMVFNLLGCGFYDTIGEVDSSGDYQPGHISTWSILGTTGFTAGATRHNSLAMSADNKIYLCYMDFAFDRKTSVITYQNNNWTVLGNYGFSAGEARKQDIEIDSNGTIYVAYQDVANGNGITVKKYVNNNWVTLGAEGFSGPAGDSSAVRQIDLGIDHANNIYVAFRDNNNQNKASVMKFSSPNWQVVGSRGFTPSAAYSVAIDFDSANNIYLACENEDLNLNEAYVFKYQSNWAQLGQTLPAGRGGFTTIKIDNQDNSYVAYEDNQNERKATVAKYQGLEWVPVGLPGCTDIRAQYLNLDFDNLNQIYLSYQRFDNDRRCALRKFNGNSWELQGANGFSTKMAYYLSMEIDNNGAIYLAYQDGENENKASVYCYY